MFLIIKGLAFLLFYLVFSHDIIGQSIGIIPEPQSVNITGETGCTKELVFAKKDINSIWLQEKIEKTEGVRFGNAGQKNVTIRLVPTFKENEYTIEIKNEKVNISGGSEIALGHGILSLIQIVTFHKLRLPEVVINDAPAYEYRGMHLDVSRHFFTVEEVKKYLDFMAFYKYNYFHWHLTDDQGWRIEIKQFPRLQEVASFREETLIGHYNDQPVRYDGRRYGGFYTQEEIKEVIQYAADRNITIVPEIEMPGHARAALAAYPELSCNGDIHPVATTWGVFEEVFCPIEETFTFLEKVLDEVMALFPGPYIHIGGDECPKSQWMYSPKGKSVQDSLKIFSGDSLQSYFIHRINTYIKSKGRKIIGWDEIADGGLADDATVMSWRGEEGGAHAANLQHQAIMTPGAYCYFDYYQSTSSKEPLAIGGYVPLEKVYSWTVTPAAVKPENKKYIIGGQGNVWTEYMADFSHVEYMAFARSMALSEVLWGTNRNYENFTDRFLDHARFWKQNGANVANKVFELKPDIVAGKGKDVTVSFKLPKEKQVNHLWAGGLEKGSSFVLKEKGEHDFLVVDSSENEEKLTLLFHPHLGTKCKLHIVPKPSDKYKGNGPGSVVNGITGSNDNYGGLEWLGFDGKNVQILMEWEEAVDIQKIGLRFFKGEGQWIYLPSKLEIFASQDGRVFEKIKSIEQFETQGKICQVDITALLKSVRFLKLHIDHFGKIPEGRQGAGHGAWLFVDEIVVE